jgi:hypothetical protein
MHKEWIKELRSHALDHYEESGWDYLVECWSDEDIALIIRESCADTYEEAFQAVAEYVDLLGDQRSEVEATIW